MKIFKNYIIFKINSKTSRRNQKITHMVLRYMVVHRSIHLVTLLSIFHQHILVSGIFFLHRMFCYMLTTQNTLQILKFRINFQNNEVLLLQKLVFQTHTETPSPVLTLFIKWCCWCWWQFHVGDFLFPISVTCIDVIYE